MTRLCGLFAYLWARLRFQPKIPLNETLKPAPRQFNQEPREPKSNAKLMLNKTLKPAST